MVVNQVRGDTFCRKYNIDPQGCMSPVNGDYIDPKGRESKREVNRVGRRTTCETNLFALARAASVSRGKDAAHCRAGLYRDRTKPRSSIETNRGSMGWATDVPCSYAVHDIPHLSFLYVVTFLTATLLPVSVYFSCTNEPQPRE